MKLLVILIVFVCVAMVGCSKRETLLALMATSLTEQFSAECGNNKSCIESVEIHGASCFDRELAEKAIKASSKLKSEINTAHIRKMQECLALASGKDYWAELDMPTVIFGKMNG